MEQFALSSSLSSDANDFKSNCSITAFFLERVL